mgnify:CR=1 FL=1
MKGNCWNCNKEIEIQMCCSGRECGCMGLPDFPFCSYECLNEWKAKQETNPSNEIIIEP